MNGLKGGKKMRKKNIWTLLAAFATLIATTMATSACIFYFYQPEEPESLKRKFDTSLS